jgi:hypothetical protein
MTDMFHLRLPASELAKLGPAHAHDPAGPRAGAALAPSAPVAAPPRVIQRRRPTHHLSGFARA